jgi:DNA polymerase-3 subunit delta
VKREPPSATGVYLILGADSYRAEEALESLLAEAVGSDRGEAVQVLHGDETTWARVLDAARSPSLFVPHRVVVVRGADGLKGSDEDVGRLLEDGLQGVTLVLVASKVDRRRVVWRQLLERGRLLPADPLKPRELRGYVWERVRSRRLQLEEEVVDELIARVGQDLRRLMGELDKLEAFAGGASVSAGDLGPLLGRGLARPAYRLSDAIVARDLRQSLELIEELLEDGESAVYVLGILYRAVRQVRGVAALRAARLGQQEIAARLRVPPFKVPDLVRAANRWPAEEVRRAQAGLSQADRRVKTGANARVALSAAVIAALGPARAVHRTA